MLPLSSIVDCSEVIGAAKERSRYSFPATSSGTCTVLSVMASERGFVFARLLPGTCSGGRRRACGGSGAPSVANLNPKVPGMPPNERDSAAATAADPGLLIDMEWGRADGHGAGEGTSTAGGIRLLALD